MMRRLRLAASVVAAVLFAQTHADAEYRHRVVLLDRGDATALVELRARLRGELEAAGFEVIAVPLAREGDPKAATESTSGALHPAAVLYLVDAGEDAENQSAELWISDRLLRRTFVLRFALAPGNSDEALRVAVQAVEILKADLAELSVTREPPPPAPAATDAGAPNARPATPHGRRPWHVLVAPGAALMRGFSGLGSTWSPVLRAGVSLPATWERRAPPIWELRGKVSALGGETEVVASAGSAHVTQSLAGLELVLRLLPDSVVQPLFLVSGDAYVVNVEGESTAPTHTRTTSSFASGGGVGLWLTPFRGLAPTLAFELSGLVEVAWAPTQIRIADQEVATAGAPLILLGASAVGVF
jgi:hypothetical protein